MTKKTIKSVNIDLSANKIESVTNEINNYKPPEITQHLVGRKYNYKERVVYGDYLVDMFFKNEICEEPKTDQKMKFEFLSKYRSWSLKKHFKSGMLTIGLFRTRYNKNKLFAAQEPVYLLSFCYNDDGRIVYNGAQYYQYLSFRECYQRCIEFKIADPRFITYEEIVQIRNRINSEDKEWSGWRVPTDTILTELSAKIGRELYDSVSFLPHLTRAKTML